MQRALSRVFPVDVFSVGVVSVALVAVSSFATACGSSSDHTETPGMGSAGTTSTVEETGPRRVALTQRIVDDNGLSSDEVAELQLYLHGRIVLRREASGSGTEITKQHTLKMLDGKAYDEVLVDSGTPGVIATGADAKGPTAVVVPSAGGTGAHLRVNFDPDHPDESFLFEPAPDGRFRYKVEPSKAVGARTIDTRREAHGHETTNFEGDDYTVVEGTYAYIEIDAERLHALIKKQRKLPGVLLPDAGSAAPSSSDAPPAASSIVAPPGSSN